MSRLLGMPAVSSSSPTPVGVCVCLSPWVLTQKGLGSGVSVQSPHPHSGTTVFPLNM